MGQWQSLPPAPRKPDQEPSSLFYRYRYLAMIGGTGLFVTSLALFSLDGDAGYTEKLGPAMLGVFGAAFALFGLLATP